jgi:two-component system NtrC family sensor kinase
MPINPFRTLQGKLTFCLTALIVAGMSAIAFWNISREKALLGKMVVREGKAVVESFGISCTNTMLYEEIGLVEEGGLLDNYISDLMRRRDLNVIYAMILDPKGKVLAHNSIREIGDSYEDEVTKRGITSGDTLFQYPSRNVLDISTPLAISTKRWGTLRIGISLETLSQEISALIWKYIVYTAGFIMIAIVMVSFLSGVMIKPLRLLSREVDETKPGDDPPQLPPPREDEIGTLQKSFHRLLKRVKEDEKEKERTQRNLLLTEKMVAIGKLTSGVAHEINNPLGGLLNCVYHFKRGGLPPERQTEYLYLMEDGIKRIQNTVTNLLEFARTPKLERTTTDVVSLIERALSLLDYQLRKSRIEVTKDISLNLPSIEVDRNQMGQVFVNIFLNAIQAMEESGVLKIGAKTVSS